MQLDLLKDGIFEGIDEDQQPRIWTLPALLSELARAKSVEYRNLRPQQSHAWHAFLVQIGALAVNRAGVDSLPTQTEEWRGLLLGLTNEQHEPWCLVVDDLRKPAFFQPPLPRDQSIEDLNNASDTPEAIGIDVTAKNHDVKRARFQVPKPDHWVYALVTLQTMQGFSGRDNYGIARMNGGFGSRPGVSIVGDMEWPTAFRSDVEVMLSERERLIRSWEYEDGGKSLLWLEEWDGARDSSLEVRKLDPFFIEICRRVRLIRDEDDKLTIRWTTTKAPRIEAKELKGRLGDPWIPIKRKDQSALTVSDRGPDYRLIADLMFGRSFERAPAQLANVSEGKHPSFVCRIYPRGQGRAGAYYERVVPIPPPVAGKMENEEEVTRLGLAAEARIEVVDLAQGKVLRPALLALHQGGESRLDYSDRVDRVYANQHEMEIDRIFFDHLFEDELEARPPELQDALWERRVFQLAKAIFETAIEEIPKPDARKYRAITKAEARFYGGARKHLPLAFLETEAQAEDEPATEGLIHAA